MVLFNLSVRECDAFLLGEVTVMLLFIHTCKE